MSLRGQDIRDFYLCLTRNDIVRMNADCRTQDRSHVPSVGTTEKSNQFIRCDAAKSGRRVARTYRAEECAK
jgi:hypothetical protein